MSQHLFAVTLVVPDYDQALNFYVEKVGFTLDQDENLGGGKRWVRISPQGEGNCSLILAKADGPEQSAAVGMQTGGRVGFFLATTDFASDYAKMIEQGIEFEEAPRSEPYGIVAVWKDPFGNRWDLIQFS